MLGRALRARIVIKLFMKINDRIHGEIEITEPIIIDLINSFAVQRLKEINQAGYEPNVDNNFNQINRFEHSVGCYFLLKKVGAPLEEQVAGLIHDVSHSAFSHCADYILDDGSQTKHSHQDNVFEECVIKSGIPCILSKYNFDIDYILDEKNFPLQETTLPDICADRIDYSLRTLIFKKEITQRGAQEILNCLKIINNNWVFVNYESAYNFTKLFLKANEVYYSGFDSAVMFNTVGEVMKYAIQKKYITEKDLYSTDKNVLDKVRKKLKVDKKLETLCKRMDRLTLSVNDPNNYEYNVFCKSRAIDPFCENKEKIIRVSDIDGKYKNDLPKHLKPKEYFLRYIE